jgi:hypothetical protein
MAQWKPLPSSNLRRVRYFKKNALLAVEFKSGRIWIYGCVPWSRYMGLLSAKSSHGKYFNRYIRLKYQFLEVPWRVARKLGLITGGKESE